MDQDMDAEALHHLMDDQGHTTEVKDPLVANTIKETSHRRRRRRRLWIALITLLVLCVIWLIVITALGATVGYAFREPTNPSQFCKPIDYDFYVNTDSCNRILVLPELTPEGTANTVPTELVVRCDGFQYETGTKGSVMVENTYNTTMEQAEIIDGDRVDQQLWTWMIVNFEAGVLASYVLNFAGQGYGSGDPGNGYRAYVNQTLSVVGGQGIDESNFAGYMTVFRSSETVPNTTFSLHLLEC